MFQKLLPALLALMAICNEGFSLGVQMSPQSAPPAQIDSTGKPADGKSDAVYVPDGPGKIVAPNTKGPDTTNKNGGEPATNVLTPLLSYNFSGGNNNLSNLTPAVNYGWIKNMGNVFRGKAKWELAINPYSAGQIDVKDSTNFLPALMLPGIAGININNFFTFHQDGNAQFIFYPVNFALKLNTNFQDSNRIIAQYNYRFGLGFRLADHFQIGVQHTWGWHNITSESEESFKKAFKTPKTHISYLTVVLETYFNSQDVNDIHSNNVLFLEWRCVTNKEDFKGFPNDRIITLGFRKNISVLNLAPAGTGKRNK